jgi:hypothetical protein
VYCTVEGGEVPEESLAFDAYWGWVHEVGDSWHTVTGTVIRPEPEPEDVSRRVVDPPGR